MLRQLRPSSELCIFDSGLKPALRGAAEFDELGDRLPKPHWDTTVAGSRCKYLHLMTKVMLETRVTNNFAFVATKQEEGSLPLILDAPRTKARFCSPSGVALCS